MGSSVGLWISVVGLVVSVVGVVISLVILSYSRSHLRLSERESLRNPQLHVEGVSFSEAGGYERVQELVRVRARLAEWEKMTDEEREAYTGSHEDADSSTTPSVRMLYARERYAGASNLGMSMYSGPVPDLVLSFQLANRGQRSARDVGGRVYFRQPTLEPINCPGFDASVHGDAYESWPRLHKGSPYREGARLKSVNVSPSSAEEVTTFNVALVKRGNGRCDVKIVLFNPDGDYVEKNVSAEV